MNMMFNLNSYTMKNLKNLVLLLALTGMGVSCSTDDLGENEGGQRVEGRSEVQIAFSGTGESQEYTRAIATESEDKIDKLEIYLFAAASAAGPYYYLETWNEGVAFDPLAPTATNFLKTAAGTGWKASLYPAELKGLPYLKLMCIANNATTGTTDAKFYGEDGTTEQLAALTKVTTDADGQNPTGTTEAEFAAVYTRNLGADDATGRIQGSLLMTGEGKTKISGSVSKVDIVLKRTVARFDIENTASRSSLTIQNVQLAQGRRNGIFWRAGESDNGVNRTPVAKDDLATSGLLATYQPVTFTDLVGANQGLTTSALYVYPNLATDESYLIIDGTFKSPTTGLQVPVSYHVPIVRTPEGAPAGTPGEYIPIRANNRYKLRITDVTQSNILGVFEVVDWTSGGGIVVKPENDAPLFAGDDAFIIGDIPSNMNAGNPAAKSFDYRMYDSSNGAFTMEIAATGKVTARKAPLTRAGETDWLVISQPTSEERDGVWYSAFKFSYTDAIGKHPVAVTFANEAASDDPALQTTVNFYSLEAPLLAPAIGQTDNAANSPGSIFVPRTSPDQADAPQATLYLVNDSQVQFDVTCKEGTTFTVAPEVTGLEITSPVGDSKTYTVKVTDPTVTETVTLTFANKEDATKTETVTIIKEETVDLEMDTDLPLTGDVDLTGTKPDYTLELTPQILAYGTLSVSIPVFSTILPVIKNPEAVEACEWVTSAESILKEAKTYRLDISIQTTIDTTGSCAIILVDPVTKNEVTVTVKVMEEVNP